MYRQTQRELIEGGVSLVEIDLIRTGEWNLCAPLEKVKDHGLGLFHICVRRGWRFKKPEVYAVNLPDRLPSIRIPLRSTDPDVMLDLQSVIDQVYENGRYGYKPDYSQPAIPLLPETDRKWAQEWIAKQLG